MNSNTEIIQLIDTYYHHNYTGKVILKSSNNFAWQVYFFQEKIVWLNGGFHPYRSWLRHLKKYFSPRESKQFSYQDLEQLELCPVNFFGNFLENNLISSSQVGEIVNSRMAEIFFDILQTKALPVQEFKIEQKNFDLELKTYFRISNIKEFIANAQETIKLLDRTGVSCYSLNLAPKIVKSAELKSKVSAAMYNNFISLFEGKSTIRDIAYKINQDTIKLSFVLLPYIRKGLIELVEVDDLFIKPRSQPKYNLASETITKNPLICCIDDSPLNYHLI
ncbi:MAG TPA: hypothetical protein ACFCUY_01615 [Xenococcaceae cyanobacterium]